MRVGVGGNKLKKRVIEVRATKNVMKDKMTGRVDIVRRIFEKIAKNYKLKSQDPQSTYLEHFQIKE